MPDIEFQRRDITRSRSKCNCDLSVTCEDKASKLKYAQVAQSVEQRTENPRVGGSIPPLGTIHNKPRFQRGFFVCRDRGSDESHRGSNNCASNFQRAQRAKPVRDKQS